MARAVSLAGTGPEPVERGRGRPLLFLHPPARPRAVKR
jgi:hypothetical protein